jgi:molecular chaperone HtpG
MSPGVSAGDESVQRGTSIEIHLTKAEAEYSDRARLSHIVKTYSDHVALPIMLAGDDDEPAEQLNAASALWTRPKSEIDEQQYTEFYHHVSHGMDAPWTVLHNQVEGVVSYTSLIFIPAMQPFDLFNPERNSRLKLYVRRVFITDDCADLLPSWLRFLRGVIDSEDLPLNVSREMLQNNPVVAKIRVATIKRVIGELKKKAEKAPEAYAAFWENFGAVVKEGIYEDRDNQEALLGLARFKSTADQKAAADPATSWVSLADYVGRMKDGQEDIFYITGESAQAVSNSPQLEAFRARGIEVLLMTDPIDEFWISTVGVFDGKTFRSATRGDVDFEKMTATESKDDKKDEKAADSSNTADDADVASLAALIKLALGEAVKDVRGSNRLTDSPVCLVADEGDMDIHLERMMRQHQRIDEASARILELNPGHPLIRKMADTVREKGAAAGEQLDDYAYLLLDQARIIEGESVPDPAAFSRRLAEVMAVGI